MIAELTAAYFVDNECSEPTGEASLFSLARFGPGSIVFLSFIVIMTILLYLFSLRTIALLIGGAGVLFFGVKSMERIQLRPIKDRKVIGEMCLVVKAVRRGQQGVVRLVKADGTMESELWSAEAADEIDEGKKARVMGRRSIVLLIDPLPSKR